MKRRKSFHLLLKSCRQLNSLTYHKSPLIIAKVSLQNYYYYELYDSFLQVMNVKEKSKNNYLVSFCLWEII